MNYYCQNNETSDIRRKMAGTLKRLLIGGDLRLTLIRVVATILFVVLVFRFILAPLRLDGTSMEPTFSHGEISLANRLAYLREDPQRGDVVAVRMRESGRSIFLLKRVVGLPGESIGFRDGKVTVDGVRMEEEYLSYASD